MTESLADWLTLREPADIAARSAAVTRAVADAIGPERRLEILDLGSGTGSNVRYLAPRLEASQHWVVADRDPLVLGAMPARMASWAAAGGYEIVRASDPVIVRLGPFECSVETRCVDLGALSDLRLYDRRHLVTASALLDLASDHWIKTLAVECRRSGAAVLFALTYNGRSHCIPAEPEDELVRGLLNEHQRANDKGFGRAAGPEAAEHAARIFAEAGYHVRREASDWVLPPDMRQLQRHLIEGWADAAVEIAPNHAGLVAGWLRRRLAHVDAGRSRVVVGHEDLAGWLPRSGFKSPV